MKFPHQDMVDEARKKAHSATVDRWAARIVPLFLLAGFAHSLYLVTYLICAKYLLNSDPRLAPRRQDAAIAILVVAYPLAIMVLASWLRLASTLRDPGFLPKGTPPPPEQSPPSPSIPPPPPSPQPHTTIPAVKSHSRPGLNLDNVAKGRVDCPPGIEQFYHKDAFVSSHARGVPRFCEECWAWKPDRSHHSSQLRRCVRRFDHFCPWVGGAIAEYNNKFFIQLAFYAGLYTTFMLVVIVWMLRVARSDCHKSDACQRWRVGGNFITGIVISSFIGFLAIGIFFRFGYSVVINETTIEELENASNNRFLVLSIHPHEVLRPSQTIGPSPPFFRTLQLPFPTITTTIDGSHPATAAAAAADGKSGDSANNSSSNNDNDQHTSISNSSSIATNDNTQSTSTTHTFAVLPIQSGTNIWNLGRLANIRAIMGNSWFDWLLPLRLSPCVRDFDSCPTTYHLGADFRALEKRFLPHRYPAGDQPDEQQKTLRKKRRLNSCLAPPGKEKAVPPGNEKAVATGDENAAPPSDEMAVSSNSENTVPSSSENAVPPAKKDVALPPLQPDAPTLDRGG